MNKSFGCTSCFHRGVFQILGNAYVENHKQVHACVVYLLSNVNDCYQETQVKRLDSCTWLMILHKHIPLGLRNLFTIVCSMFWEEVLAIPMKISLWRVKYNIIYFQLCLLALKS